MDFILLNIVRFCHGDVDKTNFYCFVEFKCVGIYSIVILSWKGIVNNETE